MLTIRPQPAACIPGTAARHVRNVAPEESSTTADHDSSVICANRSVLYAEVAVHQHADGAELLRHALEHRGDLVGRIEVGVHGHRPATGCDDVRGRSLGPSGAPGPAPVMQRHDRALGGECPARRSGRSRRQPR